jgi:predicted NBD/HSP70 family sugar kinase
MEILRPKSVRGANSGVVLRLLRQYQSLSRSDLARQSGLSEGSISRIAAELIRRDLIREDGAESSTGGRPATRLRLQERPAGIGIEIDRSQAQIAVATFLGKLLERSTIQVPSSPEEALSTIAKAVRRTLAKYLTSRIEGVGISVRGIVNSQTGILELGNAPSWVRVPIKSYFGHALKTPVHVDNNVRLAAIAEYHYGTLPEVRHSRCLLYMKADEGIGIGLVFDGKLYYGPHQAAGEFGQMVIADNDDTERLDRAGCLEKLASSTALCERYAALTKTRPPSTTVDSRVRARKICQLAQTGDEQALEALRQTCRYLGIGLANVIWGLNADAVVIDSPMNQAWSLIAPLIQSQFPYREDVISFRNLTFRPSSLGDEASLIGAATLPFQSLFTSGESIQTRKTAKAAS